MPKRILDVMNNEVMRGVRLTAKYAEYVSFRVPRKSGNFQADLFPPCRSLLPSMQFADYWSGKNEEPNRQDMRPGEHVQ